MPPFLAFGPVRRRQPLLVVAVLAALPLAACSSVDRTVPTSSIPDDFHLRHPVVLANAPEIVDIFPVGANGRLDSRDTRTLEVFATQYRDSGQGSVVIRAPEGAVDRAATDRTVIAVRRALAGFGLRGTVEMGTYPVTDPRLASPLHISFVRLQARITSRCGDWPDDLNAGATVHGWENRTYYNLGCANAKTLAAQIDDPRDLLGPRAEDPSDVQMRTRAIGLIRGTTGATPGLDPGTQWTGAEPTAISSVGGN